MNELGNLTRGSLKTAFLILLAAVTLGVALVLADGGSSLPFSPYNGVDAVQDTTPTPISTGTDCSENTTGFCPGGDTKNDSLVDPELTEGLNILSDLIELSSKSAAK